MVSEAIAGGSATAVNYFVAQKYVEALGKFADSPNQKTFLMPVEATAVLGSLAGIAELARDATAARAGEAPSAPPRPGAPNPWSPEARR
jgi:regulator of protease activity HflC (stomatin/prohibitin superfamily)